MCAGSKKKKQLLLLLSSSRLFPLLIFEMNGEQLCDPVRVNTRIFSARVKRRWAWRTW
jgi:hypothetical protein